MARQKVNVNELSLKQCVQLYLIASYTYYIYDQVVIEDHEYDTICKRLYDHFDEFEHQHKYLLSKDSLKAGTGFHYNPNDYPLMVVMAADMWLNDC